MPSGDELRSAGVENFVLFLATLEPTFFAPKWPFTAGSRFIRNTLISKKAFIRSFLCPRLKSLLCYSACFIQNLPESKDFYSVLLVRIKRDPPEQLKKLKIVCWNRPVPTCSKKHEAHFLQPLYPATLGDFQFFDRKTFPVGGPCWLRP